MNEDRAIRLDRMRFIKNTLSSSLALLAILFNVFYFINIYKSDIHTNVGNFYYQIRIGASIIYNLIFMLAAFLSSEGIKNYKIQYAYILAALGIGQIARSCNGSGAAHPRSDLSAYFCCLLPCGCSCGL